jgi:hypothetical protein
MADRENERKPAPGRFGRLTKNASFWILIFLIPILLMNVLSPRRQERGGAVILGAHDAARTAGNVARRHHHRRQAVEGALRQPVTVNDRAVREFYAILPARDSELIIQRIEDVGRRDHGGGSGSAVVGVPAHDAAVAAHHRLLDLHFPTDAVGRLEGVPVRQVEGETADRRYAEGHLRRCVRSR